MLRFQNLNHQQYLKFYYYILLLLLYYSKGLMRVSIRVKIIHIEKFSTSNEVPQNHNDLP